jgi:hypothetical protein
VKGGPQGEICTVFRCGEGWGWSISRDDSLEFAPTRCRTRKQAKEAVMAAVSGQAAG